jgi:hypothetical protein
VARTRPDGKFELREERLLAEFVARHFPKDRLLTRVRLHTPSLSAEGVPLTPQEAKLLKNFSRWADALIVRPTDLILIEAEVLPSPGIVSTLQLYARLFKGDTEFADLHHLPLRLMLVWGFGDPVLGQLARDQGIEVRVFSPPWLAEALRARFPGLPSVRTPTRTPPL